MKTETITRLSLAICLGIFLTYTGAQAQGLQPDMQYFRANDGTGLNVFETSKLDTVPFDGLKVRIGGGFALQYQAISHANANDNLVPLANNFNLATANFDIDVQLADGVRMNLRTFLSSRNHTEAYVKGGYFQIDKLDFIKKDFLSGFMQHATIKVGHMENNYGDAHFRRSDNGHALYNPFVGNYIMDSYTTEVGGEVYYQVNGMLVMLGFTNGRLNQSTTNVDTKGAFIGKIGYDKQINDDLRFRLTGSVYTTKGNNKTWLYGGDRAGARYYNVMDVVAAKSNAFSGRVNPGFNTDMTSIMINPFVKFKGLELFGILEQSSGRDKTLDAGFTGNRTWTHTAGEVIYRIGASEKVYLGARYNMAKGQLPGVETDKVTVTRFNIGGGWFLTKNILAKLEYVDQQYKDFTVGSNFNNGEFKGIVMEAAIAF